MGKTELARNLHALAENAGSIGGSCLFTVIILLKTNCVMVQN